MEEFQLEPLWRILSHSHGRESLFWWCYHSSSDYCHQNYLAKAYKIKSILFFPLADEQEEGESDERLVSVFADNKLGDYAFSLIVSLIIDDRRKGLIIAS